MTYQELLTRAYGHSTKNQPGEIATENVELLNLSRRVFEALYTIGAILSPPFYGSSSTVSSSGGSWDHPAEADTVFRLEDESGNEVVVVPIDEKDAEPNTPAVYSLGQAFWPVPAPNEAPATSDDLTVYHTVAPADPGTVNDDVPSEYPANHYDLPILQVAMYLTRKDIGGRGGEYELLAGERNKELARYVRMLQNRLPITRSRYATPKRVKDDSLVAYREILDGAAQAGG